MPANAPDKDYAMSGGIRASCKPRASFQRACTNSYFEKLGIAEQDDRSVRDSVNRDRLFCSNHPFPVFEHSGSCAEGAGT